MQRKIPKRMPLTTILPKPDSSLKIRCRLPVIANEVKRRAPPGGWNLYENGFTQPIAKAVFITVLPLLTNLAEDAYRQMTRVDNWS